MGIKVTERRHVDLLTTCLNNKLPIGACLLAKTETLNNESLPHRIGTLATVVSCAPSQTGSFSVTIQGEARFLAHNFIQKPDTTLDGEIELLAIDETPVPNKFFPLVLLLKQIVAEQNGKNPQQLNDTSRKYRYESAEWVGHRLCEVMPVQWLAKQKLLELDSAVSRLEVLRSYLTQHGLLR